jgi:predicted TIM-barrel enzyme
MANDYARDGSHLLEPVLALPCERPLMFAAAGSALVADDLAAAGVDLIVAYHSSPLRQRGMPSVAGLLPWASANELALGTLDDLLPAVAQVPLGITVCANDLLLPRNVMIDAAVAKGARATLNAPTVGLLTGPVRAELERAGLGFDREVELQTLSRQKGLIACAYAFDSAQATAVVAAGAQVVIAHLGITRDSSAERSWANVLRAAHRIIDASRRADPKCTVLLHGGPLHSPDALKALLSDLGAVGERIGFFGASVLERPSDGATPRNAVLKWREALQ